ncbi:hypothetical protein HDE69_005230 [Pedobacter cryoconitis]|uniref:Uncharacterized protein n=1 Tax=Pedobacter cryoconitis TaxID=188932 RepID=A0A7W8YZ09_9SPHI|nr:hypothetical protein [Pedobacter cryoconitis]
MYVKSRRNYGKIANEIKLFLTNVKLIILDIVP